MDVCKCIVPSWHGGTLVVEPQGCVVRLVDGAEKREGAPGVLSQNLEKKRIKSYCMLLKVTADDRCKIQRIPSGPRSGTCRLGGISNSNIIHLNYFTTGK
ncbi:hypothetical protein TNCV_931351 [Trichonephila clavipes]|uniref:Uncharacterized protein n=1 Tax=Trichonephila clavipes TaxID=2585209 RepID=A0A8X6W2M3_TRICX|nr:hypothetical protein TNCV_931351 [Trichonephila clavipes]